LSAKLKEISDEVVPGTVSKSTPKDSQFQAYIKSHNAWAKEVNGYMVPDNESKAYCLGCDRVVNEILMAWCDWNKSGIVDDYLCVDCRKDPLEVLREADEEAQIKRLAERRAQHMEAVREAGYERVESKPELWSNGEVTRRFADLQVGVEYPQTTPAYDAYIERRRQQREWRRAHSDNVDKSYILVDGTRMVKVLEQDGKVRYVRPAVDDMEPPEVYT
jgi:hypothetical protein